MLLADGSDRPGVLRETASPVTGSRMEKLRAKAPVHPHRFGNDVNISANCLLQVLHLVDKGDLSCKKRVGGVLYQFRCLQVTPYEGYLDEIEGPVHVCHDLPGPFRFTTDHHTVRVEKIVGCSITVLT
ncbi:hypothetical protein ES703_102256 [subsurface metagenome]